MVMFVSHSIYVTPVATEGGYSIADYFTLFRALLNVTSTTKNE
jgi:hypothetical protein